MIEFRQTHIGYTSTLITIGEMVLERGLFYTLIGKNGTGKTTLMNTLLGLVPVLDGEIFVDGKSVKHTSVKDRSKLVSYVPSKFEGVQHLSAREYIAMGRAPYTNFTGKTSREDMMLVDEVISQLGIQHLSEKDTSKLSDGERQIASIAKALVQQTPVILLDEPTAFLDYANRMSVQRVLKEVAKTANVCILQSSHDLELCLEFSDKLLIVDAEQKELVERENENLSKSEVIDIAFPMK